MLAASLVLASSFALPARALDSSSIITSTNSDLPPIHQMDIRKAPAFPYDNRAAVEEPLLQLGDISPIHQLVRQGMLLADSTISEGAEPERSLATQAGLAFFLTYVGVSMLAGFKELFTRIQKYSRGDK